MGRTERRRRPRRRRRRFRPKRSYSPELRLGKVRVGIPELLCFAVDGKIHPMAACDCYEHYFPRRTDGRTELHGSRSNNTDVRASWPAGRSQLFQFPEHLAWADFGAKDEEEKYF